MDNFKNKQHYTFKNIILNNITENMAFKLESFTC